MFNENFAIILEFTKYMLYTKPKLLLNLIINLKFRTFIFFKLCRNLIAFVGTLCCSFYDMKNNMIYKNI